MTCVESRPVRECLSVDTLDFKTLGESNVGEADTPPGEQSSGGGQVGEVVEHFQCGSTESHVCQSTKASAEDERDVGKTSLGSSGKDLRSLSGDGQTVESSGRGEKIRRGGGPSGSQETSVDDRRQGGDTGVLDGNDEGRFTDSATGSEVLGVGGDNDTDDESTTEVEDQDSDKHLFDGSGDVSSRVLGLSGGNGNNLGTNVGEGSLGQDGPETEELSEVTLDTGVLDKRSGRSVPVFETNDLARRSTTGRDDDTEDDQTDNGEDLDGGEPEFGFTVGTGTEEVDKDDDEETDGDPDTIVDFGGPVVDQDGSGGKFGGENDGPVVPVVPAPGLSASRFWVEYYSHGERQSGVDESLGEFNVTPGNGEVGNHLSEGDHDGETDGTHQGVTHPQTERTTVGQSTTGTQEQPCTDLT